MNYFEFFDLPIRLNVKQDELKKRYLANSKKYHPDFHTQAEAAEQTRILELSSLNNEAYRTLSSFDSRLKYVLELQDILEPEGQNKLPQDFLMEMMDLNEALMELEMDFDAERFQQTRAQIQNFEQQLRTDMAPVMDKFDRGVPDAAIAEQLKDFYLKRRYLLRIQENLDKFASA